LKSTDIAPEQSVPVGFPPVVWKGSVRSGGAMQIVAP
jgi:hypothetical protein